MCITIIFSLLQDHCAALNTYRDLYMVQCGYTLRVIGSKYVLLHLKVFPGRISKFYTIFRGDPNQKLEYIGILLSRWRKLINDKPIEELTDMATEEVARYESGALPPLVRPNKPKKSAHD
ncbi:unnamed protein product [Dibothriocephalus latus]|uniref:TFIIS central domain-containing protein n=1 Tax=Dibothriocephalus latus TaxID=60516 RepID=A0A3P7NPE8_DIBLA|nr:unnamed protein product [Dibothriocephalus latus]